MSILDNELVRKYFGCDCVMGDRVHWNMHTAENVLAAMEAGIKPGDECLIADYDSPRRWSIICYSENRNIGLWHPQWLRLPDRWQGKKECKHEGLKRYCGPDVYCEQCKKEISAVLSACHLAVPHNGPCQTKPDPIEAKIEELSKKWNLLYDGTQWLRDLVRLARESK